MKKFGLGYSLSTRRDMVRDHMRLQFFRYELSRVLRMWGAPHELAPQAKTRGLHSLSGEASKYMDSLGGYSEKSTLFKYVEGLSMEMGRIRSERKLREYYSPVKKALDECDSALRNALCNMWDRTNYSVRASKAVSSDEDVRVEHEWESQWSYSNDIYVKASWKYAVYDRGLSIIRTGKGLRFVMLARPVKSPSIPDDLTAYQVKIVGFKAKRPQQEAGWLLINGTLRDGQSLVTVSNSRDYDVNMTHAYGKTLSGALSLLRRRKINHTLDTLDI